MKSVFVSYRRSDSSDVTGRIFDYLESQFDKECLFKDVEGIEKGDDYRGAIVEALAQCRVLLVVIGDDWLTVTDDNGKPRIENTDDPVRYEITVALQRRIPIIPVLVEGASVPKEADLPRQISQLSFCNGIEVRPDPDFANDMDSLCTALTKRGIGSRRPHWAVFGAIASVVVVVGICVWFILGNGFGARSDQEPSLSEDAAPAGDGEVKYRIKVYTRDDPTSEREGTNASVFMTIIGNRDQVTIDEFDTVENNFEPDTSPDEKIVTCTDLGEIERVKLTVKISPTNPISMKEPGWLLDRVEIQNLKTQQIWNLPHGEWIEFDTTGFDALRPQQVDVALEPDSP